MKKNVKGLNDKGKLHGFQCLYNESNCDNGSYNGLLARGNFKNNNPNGYYETHHNGSRKTFYFII